MPGFITVFHYALFLLVSTALAIDPKLPNFREQTSTKTWEAIAQNNPFLDPQGTVSVAKADPLDMKRAIRAYIQNLFHDGLIKGYAFNQQGRPVGIILQNAFYKEGEYLPEEVIPEVGRVALKITAIRPAYMTIDAHPLTTELADTSFAYEITLQLPDLR